MPASVLTVSSKGQVVLPAQMRRRMNLHAGDVLAAYDRGDTIVLKRMTLPSDDDFEETLDEAESWARESGLSGDDVADAVQAVRTRKRP